MPGIIENILLATLAVLLLLAATGDLRTRIIPNWLNAAIALLAIPFWWQTGVTLWPGIAMHVGVAMGIFIVFALAFYLGAMGGGDVKLVSALSLWLPPLAVLKLLVVMSIAGGVLTLVMLIGRALATTKKKIEVPYGVAIAFAGLWLVGERYLNHFG